MKVTKVSKHEDIYFKLYYKRLTNKMASFVKKTQIYSTLKNIFLQGL